MLQYKGVRAGSAYGNLFTAGTGHPTPDLQAGPAALLLQTLNLNPVDPGPSNPQR